jgi:predicted transposase/invertase (TIGR01784 family)
MDSTISKLHEEAEAERLHKDSSDDMSEFLKAYNKAEQEDINWNRLREKSIKEGEEKGKKEGIKEGINQIALNLKTKGYSLEEIKEITGLSIQEIESLSKNAK